MATIRAAFMLYFADLALTGTALENAAKYDAGYLKFATEILTGGATQPVLWQTKVVDQYVDPIKVLNPDFRAGLYIEGGVAMARIQDPAWAFTADAQMLHQPDGGVMEVLTGGVIHRWPNYTSDGVRSDHIAQYLAFMDTYGFELLFLDSWLPSFYGTTIDDDPESTGGSQEGPTQTTAWWLEAVPTWSADLTDALEDTDREVWANGIATEFYADATEAPFLGTYKENILDYASGVLYETAYLMFGDVNEFIAGCAAIRAAQAKGGVVYFLTLPWLWTLSTPPVLPPEQDLARFYLATYLLIQDELSLFGHQPYAHIAYFGFDAGVTRVYWSDDWDIDYGDPAEPGQITSALSTRMYDRGIVVVNPTANVLAFRRAGHYRVWGQGPHIEVGPGDADDTTVSGIDIPSYSGWWLEYAVGA